MAELVFAPKAWDEYLELYGKDRKAIDRIHALIKSMCRTPYSGIGKPEPLKGNLSGCWSRRIDSGNRLVYRVKNGSVEIISCVGHYD